MSSLPSTTQFWTMEPDSFNYSSYSYSSNEQKSLTHPTHPYHVATLPPRPPPQPLNIAAHPITPQLPRDREEEHNSTIESNRKKFFSDHMVIDCYTDAELPILRRSIEPIARQFRVVEYYRSRNGYLLVLHTTDYRDDAQWMWHYQFNKIVSLYRLDHYSFVKHFDDVIRLKSFVHIIATIIERGLSRALLDAGLSVYVGKILHVTTGSGKTTLRQHASGFSIMDVDEVIVEEIIRNFPYFRLKKVPPVENVFKFCKNMSPEEVLIVMNAVRGRMSAAAAAGQIVLSGNLHLMDMADYVLIQQNPGLWKELFDHERELEMACRLGKAVSFIEDYVGNVLCCTVYQI